MAKYSEDIENKVKRLEYYLLEKYEFRYNEVFKETEKRKKGGKDKFTTLSDRELSDIRIELSKAGFVGYKSILDDLLKSSSLAKGFNPFKDYFEGLPKWTPEQPNYILQLCQYIDVKEDYQWFVRMFEKHLCRTVACALRQLDFNKHCFVFLGKQNDGKTSFIRFLIPEILKDYYKENPPLDHKDSVLALGQNIVINLDELHDLNKSDANKVKSLFSQSDTKVRSHYATKDTLQPRYASFFGTTNEREFLNDVTGNVRWIVFTINGIKHDNGKEKGYSKNINIDKVWSQAYSMVLNGELGLLKNDEIKVLENQNKEFQKVNVETELIQELFEPCNKNTPNGVVVTTTDIILALKDFTNNTININHVSVGKALTYLGFKKEAIRDETRKNPFYGYYVRVDNQKILEFLYKKPTTLLQTL